MHQIDQAKRVRRMERIDAMPEDIRRCVHDFGLTIVDAFTQCGVTKGKHIRHLVETVRAGSYQGALDGAAMKPAMPPAERRPG
ncbi:hypothetical protein [Teichococcus wenyumeiae]|nr:hypothetical protein [Pseudoroseomonas wenyumeiae]RKK04009.1 hypothetical protein D6Z83_11700 [Pseudoroseomonas wenyumeiae]